MENRTPLVSIVIPVYNGSNYMREAIDSALAQTYSNVEVIVVNDGSNDDGATDRIAKSYGDKIRYFIKKNGGVSTALNLGIKEMKGEYFSWLSHDDKYEPQKIESQIQALSKFEDKKIIAMCHTKQIDSNSNQINMINRMDIAHFDEIDPTNWEDALIELLKKGYFSGCSLLIPKKAFDEVGYFNEDLRYSQDLLMWIQILLRQYKIISTPGYYAAVRIHNGQLTQTGKSVFKNDCKIISNLLINDLSKVSTKEHNFLYYFAKYNAKYCNVSVIKQCLCIGKRHGSMSLIQDVILIVLMNYGLIRPVVRKMYYKIFMGIKTQ